MVDFADLEVMCIRNGEHTHKAKEGSGVGDKEGACDLYLEIYRPAS